MIRERSYYDLSHLRLKSANALFFGLPIDRALFLFYMRVLYIYFFLQILPWAAFFRFAPLMRIYTSRRCIRQDFLSAAGSYRRPPCGLLKKKKKTLRFFCKPFWNSPGPRVVPTLPSPTVPKITEKTASPSAACPSAEFIDLGGRC